MKYRLLLLSASKSRDVSMILDVIQADRNMADLLKSLQAAGLKCELSQEGPYTVFDPAQIVFRKLWRGELMERLKPLNKVKLISILSNHVMNGTFSFDQLVDDQALKTVKGTILEVKGVSGNLTINGATLLGRDRVPPMRSYIRWIRLFHSTNIPAVIMRTICLTDGLCSTNY